MLPKFEDLQNTVYPANLVLETISFCNLGCSLCPYKKLKRPRGVMSDATFDGIVDEVGMQSPNTVLWLAFMGEPLLQGLEIPRKVTYAKESGIQKVCLNTNGIFLTDAIQNALIEAGTDQVFISLDAMKLKTYKLVRDDFDLAIIERNVFDFAKRTAVSKTEVVVQFVVCKENEAEAEPFQKFWNDAGVTVKIRKKLGWGSAINAPDLVEMTRSIPCSWLMRQMIVLWDGRVAQCDADYEGEYSVGSVKNNGVWGLWNGPLLDRRKKHLKNNFDFEPCKSCNDWQVGISEVYKP